MPDIPDMVFPSSESTIAFVLVIAFITVAFVTGVSRGGPKDETTKTRMKWTAFAAFAIIVWMTFNAVLSWSGLLETKILPPPTLILFVACLSLAFAVAFSEIGKRLASLPFAALIGFHAFRLPLELVLHNWYDAGTMPVQMTYEGHNFDIITGVLAVVVSVWATIVRVPKAIVWIFNVVGFALLMAVIVIATTSSPVPFRQYMNDPPVLLVFHFPHSWIVSVAVIGAMIGHLILFRKLFGHRHPMDGTRQAIEISDRRRS